MTNSPAPVRSTLEISSYVNNSTSVVKFLADQKIKGLYISNGRRERTPVLNQSN